jgi:PAS domain S-box-containing protein
VTASGDGRGNERLRVRAFGPLEITCEDGRRSAEDLGGARPRQIFEILLSARGHPVQKDRLIELLWEQDRPKKATAVLESHVSVLRRHLSMCARHGRDLVTTVPGGYSLEPDAFEVDLDAFDRLVNAAVDTPVEDVLGLLEEALALASGPVLEDEPNASWATRMRVRYEEAIARARLDAAEAALALRSFVKALDHASVVAADDPANERACRTIMIAAYAAGDQDRSVRAYLQTKTALTERLGVDPLPETQALYLAILRHEAPASLVPTDVRRTEPGFRRLVDQQGAGGWWTVDSDLLVTSVIGEPGATVGLRREDVLGHTVTEVAASHDVAAILSDHRRALGGETVTRPLAVGGRTYEVHLEPMRRGEDIVGVVGVSADVTERDRTVSALEQLDERSRAAHEAGQHDIEDQLGRIFRELHGSVDRESDAMLVVDPWDDVIIAANEAAASMLGYRRQDLLTRRPSDLHREEMGAFLGFMDRVDNAGSGWTDELTCTTHDGRLLPIEMAARRLSFHRRRTVVAVLRPIARSREVDPGLLEALRGGSAS